MNLLPLLFLVPVCFAPPTSSESGTATRAAQVILRHVPLEANVLATYSFTEESALDVDHLRSTMNGDVFEREKPDRSVTQVARREWIDTTLDQEDGRRVRRTFIELEVSMEVTNSRDGAPRPDGNATGTSALARKTVEFAGPDRMIVLALLVHALCAL